MAACKNGHGPERNEVLKVAKDQKENAAGTGISGLEKKTGGFLKKMLAEFKEFINQGNVVDMAVGVVIGAAFKAIVDSLVSDLISPIIGIIFSADFSDVSVTINGSSIMIGSFINAVINFLIVAVVLFLVVKLFNSLKRINKKKEEAPAAPAEPETKECPFCRTEISIKATRCPHCTSQLEK